MYCGIALVSRLLFLPVPSSTHQTHGPNEAIVQNLPALLGKTDGALALQPRTSSQWPEHPFNRNGTNSCEDQGGADHKVHIVPTLNVEVGSGVVVGELEERLGIRPEGGIEVMQSQHHGQNGQRDS